MRNARVNHYHLLLETPESNLVSGMRRLNGVYSQTFNRRHGQVGHVMQGRYKSILVDREAYRPLQALIRSERIYREVKVMMIGGGAEEIVKDLAAARQLALWAAGIHSQDALVRIRTGEGSVDERQTCRGLG